MRRHVLLLGVFGLAACSGAGRYGYARTYVPLDAEEDLAARVEDVVYDEVRRMPDPYRGRLISWFGVVTGVESGAGGTRVAMQIRTHQDRHLCSEEGESSCRLTVSQRDGGPFSAVVTLRAEDAAGMNRVQPNSLLRVYGTLRLGEYDAQGGPVLQAQYYRHWPRGEYVTTASSGSFRR